MSFSWFSLAASIINLLILYWILQRYLFGPLLKIIKDQQDSWLKREKDLEQKELQISSREEQVEHERQELEYEVRTYYEQAMKEIEAFKESEQADARKKAETVYQQIVNAAKDEANRIRRDALQNVDEVIKDAVAKVYDSFFGDVGQGKFIVLLFESQFDKIKPLLSKDRAYTFVSSHPLNNDEQNEVSQLLEQIGASVDSFEVDKELILGFKLSWKAEMVEYSLAQQIRDYITLEEAGTIGS
ncbi:ATP synthase F0 subunit B [Coprothermobacter platensis]|uniref:ATP synthase F0 subunit B n=1 Tax=Coprothermobacter platensis TaxID=108819 RepID=UPI00037FD307|nr:ATP synthase F0 subunit B [Coprothermobacter platensis]